MLSNDLWFHDYVVHYTNAAHLISADFKDTEDRGGLFSGYDPATGAYDPTAWAYDDGTQGSDADDWGDQSTDNLPKSGDALGSGGAPGSSEVKTDPSLQDPRCVFQILRRHFARYTPEMVADTCGIGVEDFHYLADAVTQNSGRERTTSFVYAVGWTQHTLGAQFIRTAASCNCCSAIWAVPAAESWRCAGTPAFRAPPISRRSITSCRAICPCRWRVCTTRGATTYTPSAANSSRAFG